MLEIVYYVAASVDGFIAQRDGGIDWLAEFESTGEDYGYADFYASVDTLLMGSRTYEQCLTFAEWPYTTKPVWVLSRRKDIPAHTGVFVTDQSPQSLVEELVARGARRAWLVGGGQLAATFRNSGLITEYVVSVIPVVLGAGIPLFSGAGPYHRLRLVEHTLLGSGIVQLHYQAENERSSEAR